MARPILLASLIVLCGACGKDGSTSEDHDAGRGEGPSDSGGPGAQDAGQDASGDGDGDSDSDAGNSSLDSGPGEPPSLDDVDLTLGGLNQDLPEPPLNCLGMEEPSSGCISFTGEYNGTPFEGQCQGPSASVGTGGGQRNIGCRTDLADGEFRVVVLLGEDLVAPLPRAFALSAAPDGSGLTAVHVYHYGRMFFSGTQQAAAVHVYDPRVAGISYFGPGWSDTYMSEFQRGVFATTVEPKADCVPDASGFGCDTVRIRGSFSARTVPQSRM